MGGWMHRRMCEWVGGRVGGWMCEWWVGGWIDD